jgi:arylsulfatase A-like enzyme
MQTPKPNILLLCSDATRADALGCYGGQSGTTPNLDAFARESCLFERAYAPSTWTFASMASVFTSTYPSVHQLRLSKPPGQGKVQSDTLHPKLRTLAEILAGSGYQTAAIVSNLWLKPFFGVTRGFQSHRQFPDRTVAEQIVSAWETLRAELREPWFVYLHFMDCHEPFHIRDFARASGLDFGKYNPDPVTGAVTYEYFKKNFNFLETRDYEALRQLYLGELNHLDRNLAGILESNRKCLTVFTADHGELWRETALHPLNRAPHAFGHFKLPYEQLVRVPLVIRLPGTAIASRRPDPVSQVDLLPTILDLCGIPPPEGQIQGQSLFPVLCGDTRRPDGEVFCEKLDDPEFPYHERALVREAWKYIQLAAPEAEPEQSLLEPGWVPVNHSFGDAFELMGYTLARDQVRRGEPLRLTLYWRALRALKPNLLGMIFFVSQENRKVPFYAKFFPAHGHHRPEHWQPGEIVEDPLALDIPADAPAGGYALRVGLYDLDAPPVADAEDAFHHGTRIAGTIEVLAESCPAVGQPLRIGFLRRLSILRLAGCPAAVHLAPAALIRGEKLWLRVEWSRRSRKNSLVYTQLRLIPENHRAGAWTYCFQNQRGVVDPAGPEKVHRFTDDILFQPDPAMPAGRYRVALRLSRRRKVWSLLSPFIETGIILNVADQTLERLQEGCAELIGADVSSTVLDPRKPGVLRLLWKVHPSPDPGSQTPFRLVMQAGSGRQLEIPVPVPSPTSLVRVGDAARLVEQRIPLEVPTDAPEGEYEFRLVSAEGGFLPLCRVRILPDGLTTVKILGEMLFDLRSDPNERTNLVPAHPEEVQGFRARMTARIAANQREARKYIHQPPVTLDEETRRQLAALGYLEEH